MRVFRLPSLRKRGAVDGAEEGEEGGRAGSPAKLTPPGRSADCEKEKGDPRGVPGPGEIA